MKVDISPGSDAAKALSEHVEKILADSHHPEAAWTELSSKLAAYPFSLHLQLFTQCYPRWQEKPESAPAYIPSAESIAASNITSLMKKQGCTNVSDFHAFTVHKREAFWQMMVDQLGIPFDTPYQTLCDLSEGVHAPVWFKGGTLNIINACFQAAGDATALIYPDKQASLQTMTYAELDSLSNQIANSLAQQGFGSGDTIGIAMPMNHYAVAIYLGIIKLGAVVVSIADSFSAEEIAARLNIAKAKAIFTQDFTYWAGKPLSLYEKVKGACLLLSNKATRILIVAHDAEVTIPLREQDCAFEKFLLADDRFNAVSCDPMSACNILFSSGTTAAPKAIPWQHTTPIKAASDAWLNHNVKPGDVLAWPTNLGWMMGPWVIFASLINKATLALYTDAPKDRAFGQFVQDAKVSMLGVVPTLVSTWRQTQCMEGLDWQHIKVFSSTGECSNAEDMLYLMSLANYKPIIEYCGGTEIGGAYLSSTVVEKNYPALFNGPTMGLDILLIDDQGQVTDLGEVAILPPSIGLSTTLLNANHEEIYYEHMPRSPDGKLLRRHGDQAMRYPGGHYSILGRADDAMNLGGIKISAAELERCLTGIPDILEVAAIAIPPPHNGPSWLIIYAATTGNPDKTEVIKRMQKKINAGLNPLFKIHDLVFVSELPKTASNKIMRRTLRKLAQQSLS